MLMHLLWIKPMLFWLGVGMLLNVNDKNIYIYIDLSLQKFPLWEIISNILTARDLKCPLCGFDSEI